MNTYTVRALTEIEAKDVARISGNHAQFRTERKSHASGTGPAPDYPAWTGRFEVNVSELLEIIERLTRPAAEPVKLDGCTCAGIAGSHRAGCQWSMNPAPARSRMARVTGTGWPA